MPAQVENDRSARELGRVYTSSKNRVEPIAGPRKYGGSS